VPSGVPCWIELACSDEAVMQNFYGRLFGWDYELRRDPATPTGRYSIASLGGVQVGGLYRAPAESARGWTVHLAVQQAASAAEWVESLGGRVTLGPVEVPGRGNILHAVDPTGAPVVFWEPSATWEFGVGVPHTFSGADLNTHDGEGADYFYCKLFNYVSQQIGDAVTVDYVAWHIDRFPVLYRYVMGPEYSPDTPPHWMIYFVVDPARGTDATAGQAIMLGGNVVIQPYDSAFGRMAILADPEGAVFAVIDHSQATDSGRAEVDDPYDD
jgi:hypothetical protein